MSPYLLQLKTAAILLFAPYALPSIMEQQAEGTAMTPYLQWMTVGTLVIFALYGLRCLLAGHGTPVRKRALLTAAIALVLTVRLGLEFARVGYVTLNETIDISYTLGLEEANAPEGGPFAEEESGESGEYAEEDSEEDAEDEYEEYAEDDYEEEEEEEEEDALTDGVLRPLFDFDITQLSFFFGAVGVCLAAALANCITRRNAAAAGMDAFAPFGALAAALFRAGEMAEPLHFGGKQLPEGSPIAFFPFALEGRVAGGPPDGPGWVPAWFPSVFFLSALFALAIAVIAFIISVRGRGRTGFVFTLTLFFLCVPQIMCESMRGESIRWLFVHVEQLLCAATALGVLLIWVIGSRETPFLRRFAPLFIMIVCMGLIVVTEFAIDGKWFNFTKTFCYIFMTFVVTGMGFAGAWAARNWNRSGKKPAEA